MFVIFVRQNNQINKVMIFIKKLVKQLMSLDLDYMYSDDRDFYKSEQKRIEKFKEELKTLTAEGMEMFRNECLESYKEYQDELSKAISRLGLDIEIPKKEIQQIKKEEMENLNEKLNENLNDVDMTDIVPLNAEFISNNNDVLSESFKSLVAFDVTEKQLSSLSVKYSSLLVKDLEDADTIAVVEQGIKEVKKIRIAVDKRHKEIKAPFLSKCNYIDEMKNTLRSVLDPIENHLKIQSKSISDMREVEFRRVEEEERLFLENRINILKENGVSFNEGVYEIGSVSVDQTTIKNLSEEKFKDLVNKTKAENEKILEAEKLEAERKEKEEAERIAENKRLNDQRIQQEEERQRLLDEQKEMQLEKERMQLEIEESKKLIEQQKLDLKKQLDDAKTQIQTSEIIKLGFEVRNGIAIINLNLCSGSQILELPYSDEDLENVLKQLKELKISTTELNETKELEAEKAENQRLENEKIEADRLAKEKIAENKRIAKIKESLKPDALKIEKYINSLKGIKLEVLENEIMNKKIALFQASLKDLTNDLQVDLNEILK